jgi:hypothetical protein
MERDVDRFAMKIGAPLAALAGSAVALFFASCSSTTVNVYIVDDGGGPADATTRDGSGAASSSSSGAGSVDATTNDSSPASSSGGGSGSSGSSSSGSSSGSSGSSEGGSSSGGSSGSSGASSSGGFVSSDASTGSCPDAGGPLGCYVPTGCTTSLSGYVYDPAGKVPLYNATVFVPSDPAGALPTITPGTSACGSCAAPIGDYVAATTTGPTGYFSLPGVPATTHVPFVVQIGKWRREVFLPEVTACTDNAVAAANSRLPAMQSEGSMPQMALLTGGADNIACFLAGIGIDSTEWTAPHGGGRLDVYQGVGGAGLTNGTAGACNTSDASCPLWSTTADLQYYDLAVLGCEGGTNDQTKAAPAMENMRTWLDEGGKVLATHFHYTWFKDGPANGCSDCTDFANSATWLGVSSGSASGNYAVDTSFYGGNILQQWLVHQSLVTGDTIALSEVADSVGAVGPAAQRWIYDPTTGDAKYMTTLTPIGAADAGAPYCGKAVFTDLHEGSSAILTTSGPPAAVPGACTASTGVTPQQAALEFLFFDLSGCAFDESVAPPGAPASSP